MGHHFINLLSIHKPDSRPDEGYELETAQEAVGHSCADLSTQRRGVAVRNDSKYGWYVKENVIELALPRSPTYPDPDADTGEQAMTYSLCPHDAHLVRCGYGRVPRRSVS